MIARREQSPARPPRRGRAIKHWVALGALGALLAGCFGGSDVAQTSRTATEHPEGSEPTPRPEPGTAVALAWSKTLAHWPGTVTVSGSQVIVADGQGVISTYGVDDGTRGWEVRLDELTGEVLPAIDDHTVLLSAVDQFIALERTTGATRWSVPTDPAPAAGDGRSLAMGVALVGDPSRAGAPAIAVTASDTGVLRGRRIDDGSEVWAVAGDGWLAGPMAVHNPSGAVVVISQTPHAALVRVLDGLTGATRWSREIAPDPAAPVIAGDVLILAAGGDDGSGRAGWIESLDLATGRERWSTELPAGFEPYQVPAVDTAAGEVALVDRMGTASLIELATGRIRWQVATEGVIIAGRVALTDGFMAFTNSKREVMVLERDTGRRWGKITRDQEPRSLPISIAHVGDRLFVGWRWVEGSPLDALDLAGAG